jgi:hypothetical protein
MDSISGSGDRARSAHITDLKKGDCHGEPRLRPVDSVQISGLRDRAATPVTIATLSSEGPAAQAPYHFALNYSIGDIMTDAVKAARFEQEYLRYEGRFFAVARHPESGLTFDGSRLDEKTGLPVEARRWSAPSKECLDMGLCIKALAGDSRAALVVAGGDESKARALSAEILEKKIDSFIEFHRKYPGYGGFLPWFVSGKEMEPTADWRGKICGLDNGEWLWTILLAECALRSGGFEKIADKYSAYIDTVMRNLTKVFYDEKAGKVRADVKVVDPSSPDSPHETISHMTGEHGVHEGSMLVLFTTLFGKGISEKAIRKIWDGITMKRVEHPHGTTWEGYWGSSHESWAYLVLPFRDLPGFRDLFRIREKIRTQNAAERSYPGLASSTNEPGGTGYLDGSGIEGIASQPVRNNHVYAVYGAFPLLLEFSSCESKAANCGLAWLLNMLQAPKMQGPAGGGESGTNDGKLFSPMKTIDGSFANVLALCGGLEKETSDMLRHYGKYERFLSIMKGEYDEAFGGAPLREPSGFALPSKGVPQDQMPDYECPRPEPPTLALPDPRL